MGRQFLPPPESTRTSAIVCVHGAWVGEWSWLPIEPLLRASGRPVHLVSLTGHGARSRESGPHVTLAHHAADVIDYVETYDLTDITLVGHSYGGRVITQASPRLADRIAAMVYLDAHAPVADDPGQPASRVAEAQAHGGLLPFASEYTPNPELLGGEEGVDWFMARLMPQSFGCLTSPWVGPLPPSARKTFVFASGYEPTRFAHYADICRDDPEWSYHDLPGQHFLMLSHPEEVTAIIVEA